jgi:hypothetical protein
MEIKEYNRDDVCPICRDEFGKRQDRRLECGHILHEDCYLDLLEKSAWKYVFDGSEFVYKLIDLRL